MVRRSGWQRLGLALALAALGVVPVRAAVDDHPDRVQRLSDGRRLHYAQYGDPQGVLVLYFHGTPGSHLEVGLIDEELEASHVRLLSVNRPGMGRSTYDPRRRITDWPCDVAELVAAEAGPGAQFGLIGFSGGAPYALACARAMPDRIKHMALVSGHTPPGVCVQPGNQDRAIDWVRRHPVVSDALVTFLGRRLDRRPDRVAQLVANSWSAGDRRLVMCDPRLKRRLIANLNEAVLCGPDGVTRDIELLGSCWGFAVADAAGVPASVWQGGCDPIVTPSMGRYFHRHLPGSTWHFDPTGGHVTTFKNAVHEILQQFNGDVLIQTAARQNSPDATSLPDAR